MGDIHLVDFLKTRTQSEVALLMGVTQGAVHQMVKGNRDVYFSPNPEGGYEFYEIKKPRRRSAA